MRLANIMLVAGTMAITNACGNESLKEPSTSSAPQLAALEGSSCVLQVNRVWDRSAAPTCPHEDLPEAAYSSTQDGSVYEIRFSDDGSGVAVGSTPLVGVLETASDERRSFDLKEGTFAGGRLLVWTSGEAFEAELSIYGSGVPILQSERGILTCGEGEGLPAARMTCGNMLLTASTSDACAPLDAVAVAGEGGGHCNCMMGYAWSGSECVALADCRCEGADCGKLAHTLDECESQHSHCAGRPDALSCGSAALHQATHGTCDAMDVTATGNCNCLIGWTWNGLACVALGGCACVGKDCDRLSASLKECQAQHDKCG